MKWSLWFFICASELNSADFLKKKKNFFHLQFSMFNNPESRVLKIHQINYQLAEIQKAEFWFQNAKYEFDVYVLDVAQIERAKLSGQNSD